MHHRLIALTVSILLAGCGGYDDPDSTAATPKITPPGPASSPAAVVAGAAAAIVKVNLNTATQEQFLALPEVNERMAHEFDEYRPYASIRQFRREMSKYVDDAQIARYENLVFVPIAMNDCDAATLQQIPGVDAGAAETLMAGRPYASREAFLAALAKHVDAGAVAVAGTYLAE